MKVAYNYCSVLELILYIFMGIMHYTFNALFLCIIMKFHLAVDFFYIDGVLNFYYVIIAALTNAFTSIG